LGSGKRQVRPQKFRQWNIDEERLNTRPRTIASNGPTVLVDGNGGIGQVIAERAMDLAIERARDFGISFVAVRNSNHFLTYEDRKRNGIPIHEKLVADLMSLAGRLSIEPPFNI